MDCLFCQIAGHRVESVKIHEDEVVLAFLDVAPIRPGHTQIIPKVHIETIEDLPNDVGSRILHLGQRIARRMKEVDGVERVAFAFTGGDHPHVHAHIVPMQEKTDITSARYIVGGEGIQWRSKHPVKPLDELERVELGEI